MPIQVTCPSCLKRFQVSDKFAGKTGPCPNCKKQIKVPDESEEVVIHAPEDAAPKDKEGKSLLKPIERTETEVTNKGIFITAGSVLVAIGVAIGFRFAGGAPVWAAAVGAVFLGPPLVWAGYSFVRDSELAPYVGAELRNRVLILSAIFAVLWLLYAFVPSYLNEKPPSEMSYMAFGIILSVMIGLGAVASSATFELEMTSGLAHSGLYFIVTVLLAVLSGITLAAAGG